MKYQEIEGDLISLALQGKFDVITHGCNCFCNMGAGIALQMAKNFAADKFRLELLTELKWDSDDEDAVQYEVPTDNKGNINKLGCIDYQLKYIWLKHPCGHPYAMNHKTVGQKDVLDLVVINSYSQFGFGRNHSNGTSIPLDYEALTLCLRKINHIFKGKHIGLPKIGTGLAQGDWNIVKNIIIKELQDMNISVIIYKP